MSGLSNELDKLLVRCRKLFLHCGEFDSDLRLGTVFVTEELRAFKWELPSASSKAERVDLGLQFLLEKVTSEGKPALLVFVSALQTRYLPGDSLHDELASLFQEINAASSKLSQNSTHNIPLSVQRSVQRFARSERSPFTEIHNFYNDQGWVITGGTVNFNQPVSVGTDRKPPLKSGYTQLRQYLQAEQFREADQETARIIFTLVGRLEEGWLRSHDIEQLPCPDFQILNRLWLNFSDSRFGFSVQRKIWLSLGGQSGEFNGDLVRKFGDLVGWRVHQDWLDYDKLNFSKSAPIGHLPSLRFSDLKRGINSIDIWKNNFKSFLALSEIHLMS